MESMISDPHIGTVAPMHFSYSTLNSSLEGCEVSSGGHPLSAVAEDSNQSVTSTDQSVLTPGELISKLDMVVKKLQKKDYRNLFMWPWTESFAPGFNQTYPQQQTLAQIGKDISEAKIHSVQSFYSICFAIFENVAQFGGDPETFLFKYGRKMQFFLQKEVLKVFPTFSVPENSVAEASGSEILARKRSFVEAEAESAQEPDGNEASNTLPKLTQLETFVLAALPNQPAQEVSSLSDCVGTTESGEKMLKILTPFDNSKVETSNSYINVQTKVEKSKLKVKPYKYFNFGPFSSHAPTYDSSLSYFTKDESDLLYQEYFGKPQKQFAREMLHFAEKHEFMTTYFARDYYDSVMNNPNIPDDIEIPSNLAESNHDPPSDDELRKLKELSKLGIDVSFLDPKPSVKVPTEKELKSLTPNELLERMIKLQNHRMSKSQVNSKLFPQEEKMSAILMTKLAHALGQGHS